MCERKLFSKAKDCMFYCRNDFDFCPLIVWAIDDVTCEGCKGPVEENKRIGYRWSFEVLTFLWEFSTASTVLLVQCTSNFNQKLKFTEVHVLFQKLFLFDTNHNGWTDYQNKNGQCRVKKSKTTLVLEIRSLHQRACEKWRNNHGFYRSKEKCFRSFSLGNIIRDYQWWGEIVIYNKY